MDGANRGDKVGLVNFARDAGLPDCGSLSCGLESCGCPESADYVTGADRVTGVDRVNPEEDFERIYRIENLAGVIG